MKLPAISTSLIALATLASGTAPAQSMVYRAPAITLGTIHPQNGTEHYVMLRRAKGDSADKQFSSVTKVQESISGSLVPETRTIITYNWDGGRTTVDTTIVVTSNLAPILERTLTPGRIVSYDFNGLAVTGKMGAPASIKMINDTLPEPAYNSTDLDLVVGSLPLQDGYHIVLPLYDPEFPGFRNAEVTVTGTENFPTARGVRKAWVLEVVEPKRAPLHYRVDTMTHQTLQRQFTEPTNGMTVHFQLAG